MSDWQVGDLAVCVDATARMNSTLPAPPLAEGAIYTVAAVHRSLRGLEVVEASCDPAIAFKVERFRKIDKHESCEDEFVTLLKRSKVSA